MKSENRDADSWAIMPVVLAFIVLVQGAWWLSLEQVTFADGDSYLRMLRIEQLLTTRAWFDSTLAGVNAPFGVDLHWTRPLDVVLLVIAAPLMPFMEVRDAIYAAGVWVSPILHAGSAIAMLWALRPLLGRIGGAVAAALTATQIAWLSFAVVGRADHHMLFALIGIVVIGFMLRSFDGRAAGAPAAAGFATAAGLWVGPEFSVFAGFVLGFLGMRWLVGVSNSARQAATYSGALIAGLVAALLIERGGDLLTVEYDRLSIFHAVAIAVIYVFWRIIELAETRMRTSVWLRLIWAGAGVSVFAAVVVRFFPGTLGYPFADVDPDFLRIQANISDYQGLNDVDRFLRYLGAVVFAAPWLVYRIWRGPDRTAWLFIAAGLLLYMTIAVTWSRWMLYAAMFAIIPLADLLVVTDRRMFDRIGPPIRAMAKAGAALVLIFAPAALGFILKDTPSGEATRVECPVDGLAAALREAPVIDRSDIVVSAPNFGPEIRYRAGTPVVAALSHRNTDGILDSYRLMLSEDAGDIRRRVAARDIGVLVICPGSGAESYLREDATPGSLYARLVDGDPPPGIVEAPLPDEDQGAFRVYRIVEPAL